MGERVLTRVHSLRERLDETLSAHRNEILALLSRFVFKIIVLKDHYKSKTMLLFRLC